MVKVFDSMTKSIAKILIENVEMNKNNPLISYLEVANRTGNRIHHRNLGEYLYNISNACKDINLPYLSVIVCNKDTSMPGNGFFEEYYPGLDDKGRMKAFSNCIEEISLCKDWDKLKAYMNIVN